MSSFDDLFILIEHPPISLNHAFANGSRGRYRTQSYNQWKRVISSKLPPFISIWIPPPYRVIYEFGVNNPLSVDTDNLIKTIQDAVSEEYKISDRDFWEISARKKRVEKWCEYIAIRIAPLVWGESEKKDQKFYLKRSK